MTFGLAKHYPVAGIPADFFNVAPGALHQKHVALRDSAVAEFVDDIISASSYTEDVDIVAVAEIKTRDGLFEDI